jgi:hypothetical protein
MTGPIGAVMDVDGMAGPIDPVVDVDGRAGPIVAPVVGRMAGPIDPVVDVDGMVGPIDPVVDVDGRAGPIVAWDIADGPVVPEKSAPVESDWAKGSTESSAPPVKSNETTEVPEVFVRGFSAGFIFCRFCDCDAIPDRSSVDSITDQDRTVIANRQLSPKCVEDDLYNPFKDLERHCRCG